MSPADFRNQILARLSQRELTFLLPDLERVPLRLRQVIEVKNNPISHLYFVEHGFVSFVASGRTPAVEIGIIGNEGVTGVLVLLGALRSPYGAFVQAEGEAFRIRTKALLRASARSELLRSILLRYVYGFFVQVADTAIANSHGKIEQRLARWLLMAHDRLDSDDLSLTHDLLSMMLGVQRPGVTLALASLQEKGLVVAKRGLVTVIDRPGLVKVAGVLYGGAEAELKRLF